MRSLSAVEALSAWVGHIRFFQLSRTVPVHFVHWMPWLGLLGFILALASFSKIIPVRPRDILALSLIPRFVTIPSCVLLLHLIGIRAALGRHSNYYSALA